MKTFDIIAVAVCVLGCGFLWWMAARAERVVSTKTKLLWLLIPAAAVLVAKDGPELSLLPLYLGAVIAGLGFFTEKKTARQKLVVSGAAVMLLTFPVCLLNPRYRTKDYTGDFEKGFAAMREHYVLAEHKGIDWDALYAKYLPKFEQAETDRSASENYLAWAAFTGEFHDGHVNYVTDTDDINRAVREMLGNDYGLVVMRCADGTFAAVCCDDSLAEQGIKNGTVITKWDGKSPDAVSKEAPAYGLNFFTYDKNTETIPVQFDSFPDIDNELFWSAVFCAGIGGDSVTVTYLDESGAEQTAVLAKCGDYFDRLENAQKGIDRGVDAGNLQWKKLNDTTACLRIKSMSYDSKTYTSSDENAFDEMKDEIRSTILQYQEQGVKDVIIDIRSNSGGSGSMVMGLAEMFAPKGEHFYVSCGAWDDAAKCWATDENGNYVQDEVMTYQGEQLLGDGRVILLVNYASVSAADHLTHLLRGLENVTVMGFTEPNGSAQAVGGIEMENGSLQFSNCVMLDEDGSIFIDSGKDRQSGSDADIIVPFDSEAIHALFDEKRDYVLEQALAMLQ